MVQQLVVSGNELRGEREKMATVRKYAFGLNMRVVSFSPAKPGDLNYER